MTSGLSSNYRTDRRERPSGNYMIESSSFKATESNYSDCIDKKHLIFRDTFSFMIIMTVIMMCYNISYYALLYPNSEFSWEQMEKIIRNGYWMLFGELNLDGDTLSDCTSNRTLYEIGPLQRCPTQLGLYITPYLKAVYGLIAVILLLNLLIAMYSDTFQKVQQESEFYWSQLQTDFLEEYSIKTVFPIHLQLLVLPAAIIHAIIWFFCPFLCCKLFNKCMKDDDDDNYLEDNDDDYDEEDDKNDKNTSLNYYPMFVRVFLYNTNFDLKLKTTKEAEGNGALKAKGEIDLMEVDRITMLQRQMDTNNKKQEKHNDKIDRRTQKMTTRLRNMDTTLKGIKKLLLLSTITASQESEIVEDEDEQNVSTSSSSSDDDSSSQSISSDEDYHDHRKDADCKMQ
ncbi:Hypothetical predicted protein [Mytilus galloprovincialis]|uniref:Ion transport domain-containing protein n=1 Tax=Mytilus galloprovincialis TaxID=29158 RepID=A0A8B6CPU0_MYTGA|nr:Hypothetical predicted protein [Mytilus galloprovincialis]